MLSTRPAFTLAALLLVASAARADWMEVYRKHDELEGKLEEVLPDHTKVTSDAGRKEVKEKAVPLLKEMVANLESIKDEAAGGLYSWHHIELRSLLYALGDEETKTKLAEWIKLTRGDDHTRDELDGEYFRITTDYFNAADDAARTKTIDAFAILAKIDQAFARKQVTKTNGQLANHQASGAAEFMLSITTDEKLQDKILDVLRGNLSSMSSALVTLKYEAPRKLRSALNQPVSFQYQTIDGKTLKAPDFAGKVLVLAFFDTEKPRSMKELARANRLSILNKSKGVEVVGVSSDKQRADLSLFLKANPGYKIPILFDAFIAEHEGLHPLTSLYGVSKFPFTLLVDRKGVLRFANPADLEAKVKQLVEEKP